MTGMNGITHHLTDALLMGYAAGALPEAFDLVVATHVSMCDECRARLAACEALGGAVLDAEEGAALSDDCLAATLRLIGDGARNPILAAPAPRRQGIFPAPLAAYVGGGEEAVRWRPAGMGVRQAILKTARDARVRLLAIPPGAAIPDHGHRGIELTLVLKGAFRDEFGHYGPGDVQVADETTEHTPVAEPGEVCICLAAADARLRFSGLLPRLAQPFVGI